MSFYSAKGERTAHAHQGYRTSAASHAVGEPSIGLPSSAGETNRREPQEWAPDASDPRTTRRLRIQPRVRLRQMKQCVKADSLTPAWTCHKVALGTDGDRRRGSRPIQVTGFALTGEALPSRQGRFPQTPT